MRYRPKSDPEVKQHEKIVNRVARRSLLDMVTTKSTVDRKNLQSCALNNLHSGTSVLPKNGQIK